MTPRHRALMRPGRSATLAALTLVSAILVSVLSFQGAAAAFSPSAQVAATTSMGAFNPAMAPTGGDGGGGTVKGSRGVCPSSGVDSAKMDNTGLPVNRWVESTDNFHSRLKSTSPGDLADKASRGGLAAMFFSLGNVAWSVSTSLSEMAVNMCVLDKVGGLVDRMAGKIGTAILKSTIPAILLGFGIFVYIFRMSRGRGGTSKLIIAKLAVLAVFLIMLNGATNSTGGGIKGQEGKPYVPGSGSPGWFVTTVDQVVSSSASSLGDKLGDNIIRGADYGPNGPGNLACAPYVRAMKENYRELYGSDLYAASTVVPLTLTSIWEQSGLVQWKRSQFGSQNPYGDAMYCRVLDYYADVPRKKISLDNGKLDVQLGDFSIGTTMQTAQAVLPGTADIKTAIGPELGGQKWEYEDAIDPRFLAWTDSSSQVHRDRAWVGWAACSTPTEFGVNLVHKDKTTPATKAELATNCKNLFSKLDWSEGDKGSFDWDDSEDDIKSDVATSEARDFLMSLHGKQALDTIGNGLVYMFSALMVAFVFVLFSIAIIVAKLMAVIMMFGVFLLLLAMLTPAANPDRLADLAKQYFGLSLFAWGAQFVMGILAVITGLFVQIGNAVVPGGDGSTMGVLWTGLAPVAAVLGMNTLFKKMKMPSPLSMNAGMSFGKLAASGALGGVAAGATSSLLDRAMHRGKNAVVNRSMSVISGARPGAKRSEVTPRPRPGQGKDAPAPQQPDTSSETSKDKKSKGTTALPPRGQRTIAQIKEARAARSDERKAAKKWLNDEATDEQKAAIKRQKRRNAAKGLGRTLGTAAKLPTKALTANNMGGKMLRGAGALGLAGAVSMGAMAALPAAALGLGVAGAVKANRALRARNPERHKTVRQERTSAAVDSYREAMEAQRLREKQERKAQKKQEKQDRKSNGEVLGGKKPPSDASQRTVPVPPPVAGNRPEPKAHGGVLSPSTVSAAERRRRAQEAVRMAQRPNAVPPASSLIPPAAQQAFGAGPGTKNPDAPVIPKMPHEPEGGWRVLDPQAGPRKARTVTPIESPEPTKVTPRSARKVAPTKDPEPEFATVPTRSNPRRVVTTPAGRSNPEPSRNPEPAPARPAPKKSPVA